MRPNFARAWRFALSCSVYEIAIQYPADLRPAVEHNEVLQRHDHAKGVQQDFSILPNPCSPLQARHLPSLGNHRELHVLYERRNHHRRDLHRSCSLSESLSELSKSCQAFEPIASQHSAPILFRLSLLSPGGHFRRVGAAHRRCDESRHRHHHRYRPQHEHHRCTPVFWNSR